MIYYGLKLHRIVWRILAETGSEEKNELYDNVVEARVHEEASEIAGLRKNGVEPVDAQYNCILCEVAMRKMRNLVESGEWCESNECKLCIAPTKCTQAHSDYDEWCDAETEDERKLYATKILLWKPKYKER